MTRWLCTLDVIVESHRVHHGASLPHKYTKLYQMCTLCANPKDDGNIGRKWWQPMTPVPNSHRRLHTCTHRRLQSNRICTLINGTNKTSTILTCTTHSHTRQRKKFEQIFVCFTTPSIISECGVVVVVVVSDRAVHNQQFSHIKQPARTTVPLLPFFVATPAFGNTKIVTSYQLNAGFK